MFIKSIQSFFILLNFYLIVLLIYNFNRYKSFYGCLVYLLP